MSLDLGGGVVAPAASGLAMIAKTVNFNAGATDTIIPIVLPPGFTRWALSSVRISGASQTLTTATVGLYTAPAAGGTALITAATAMTISTAAEGTTNNMQTIAAVNAATISWNLAQVYFRIATPQGAPATANVEIAIIPLP
jgi:hypothetical protein